MLKPYQICVFKSCNTLKVVRPIPIRRGLTEVCANMGNSVYRTDGKNMGDPAS